ncbi:hypothetical protein DPMN_139181 [Dreissena polymorpha]|uniref:Uncharacterized protein n=1 Tax=Dreissena polymorpha TaxID=45954 RepID=A0A9D4JJ85_DREPO|nr:hypothetical protein DPMN_139181 [Dreissena polymorpha]
MFQLYTYIHIENTAPTVGGHVFQMFTTIFKLTRYPHNLSFLLYKYKEKDPPPPPGGHVFLLIQTFFELNLRIQESNVLTKCHEDWTKNVTSRVFTCFHYIHIEKNALPPGGHVFSPIWTIFNPVGDINETNVLTKFHDDWAKIVTSRVFTRNTAPHPGSYVFQWTKTIFELNQYIIKTNILTNFVLGRGIIGTNVLTKFHDDRTINVASRVFTRQMLTTDARQTTDKR